MTIKELSPKLQLSFDEYIETWRSLITEYYSRGMDRSITDKIPRLDEQGLTRYSAELTAVMLFLALNAWASRKRIAQAVRTRVEQAVIEDFYRKIYIEDDLTEEYKKFYDLKSALFSRLLSNADAANPKMKRSIIIGFARYLAAQVSDKPERDNLKLIESLSVILAEASGIFNQLAENSAPDAQIIGKTKFIVQK